MLNVFAQIILQVYLKIPKWQIYISLVWKPWMSPGNCLRGDLEARATLTYDAAHGRWWPGSSEHTAIARFTTVPSH